MVPPPASAATSARPGPPIEPPSTRTTPMSAARWVDDSAPEEPPGAGPLVALSNRTCRELFKRMATQTGSHYNLTAGLHLSGSDVGRESTQELLNEPEPMI